MERGVTEQGAFNQDADDTAETDDELDDDEAGECDESSLSLSLSLSEPGTCAPERGQPRERREVEKQQDQCCLPMDDLRPQAHLILEQSL